MKILVIEDEHMIASSIKQGLEQETFAVDTAFDGEIGLDLALSEDYDVIILDLMLPKMDGLHVCQQIRAAGNHTPIIMLTAKGMTADKVTGLSSGADDYLVKPFAFEELLARLRALTRRPKETLTQVLTVGDLSLDTTKFAVTFKDQAVKLSSKEFALLEYLMRHPNQILSKDQIIRHVWNYDDEVLPNTIEAYIGNLRRKIDKAENLIRTIRGFGYLIGNHV